MNSETEFKEEIKRLVEILESCELCPRKCRVNRMRGERGCCGSGRELEISSYGPHFGEEPELVGRFGSGTVFLTNCNLHCVYCQNYEISHLGYGEEVSIGETADIMLGLERRGCHNINLVTPTHYSTQLVQAIVTARSSGLKVPIVWNCGGYENVEVIKLLEGFVDIYMPDIKYGVRESAEKYSDAPDYFERSKEAVLEMQRQVGDLKVDGRGVAYRGLLIRHLVLPNNLAGSEEVLEFISNEVSRDCYVNIMAQYRPCGKASDFEELNRRPTRDEYMSVIKAARSLGLQRGLE
jgi:putative pyruvate formate lyase activating enzyme